MKNSDSSNEAQNPSGVAAERADEASDLVAGLQCEGYRKLLAAVEADERRDEQAGRRHFHNYREKLAWAVNRANHYAVKTGLKAEDILDAWETRRNYWYMNYYQDSCQPTIEGERVRVFETTQDLLAAIGDARFRCPKCEQVSTSPYECNVCDWKVYGLFRDLGKGVNVFVKEELKGELIFMPVAWATKPDTALP